MNHWVQLALTIPVYLVGYEFLRQKCYRKSIRNRMPNMNVLIAVGSTAAFVYSLVWIADRVRQNSICFMKQPLQLSHLYSWEII